MNPLKLLRHAKPKNEYKEYVIGIWNDIPNCTKKTVDTIYSKLTFPKQINISKLNLKYNSHKLVMNISTVIQQKKTENGYKAYVTGIWNGIPNSIAKRNTNRIYAGLTFPAMTCYHNILKPDLKDYSEKLMMNMCTIVELAKPEDGYKEYITGILNNIPDYVTQKNMNVISSGLTFTGAVVSYVCPDLCIVSHICILGANVIRLSPKIKKLCKTDSENNSGDTENNSDDAENISDDNLHVDTETI